MGDVWRAEVVLGVPDADTAGAIQVMTRLPPVNTSAAAKLRLDGPLAA